MGHLSDLLGVSLIILISIVLVLYLYFIYSFTFWKRKGVKGPIPTFPLGNFSEVIKKTTHVLEITTKFYNEFKSEPFFGIYFLNNPILVVNDLQLINKVLIKDFDIFNSHGMFNDPILTPLGNHLFTKEGHVWRETRSKLSHLFTPGKIKIMSNTMIETQREFCSYFNTLYEKNNVVNFKKVFDCFTIANISNCGFGLKCDAYGDEDPEILVHGREFITASHLKQRLCLFLSILQPKLVQLLRLSGVTPETEAYFKNLIRATTEYREKNNIVRKDILQQLINLKNNQLCDDSGRIVEAGSITIEEMAAESALFFAAGFHTTSSTASSTLVSLAQYPEIQTKLRKEILEVLQQQKTPGVLTFEDLQKMKYLNMVLEESLRLYPALNMLLRKSLDDYEFEGLKIKKGTQLFIPVKGIHLDPSYYSDPHRFDPERFSPEEKAKRPSCSFIPFGDGPRLCIGFRFAMVQLKLAIVAIISRYEVSLTESTSTKPDINAFVYSPSNACLKVKKIN